MISTTKQREVYKFEYMSQEMPILRAFLALSMFVDNQMTILSNLRKEYYLQAFKTSSKNLHMRSTEARSNFSLME